MRAVETGVLPEDDPTLLEESSFCLGCRACEPVCPAGVRYGALLEEWRDYLWNGSRRSWRLRPLLWAVNRTTRVRALGLVRRHARTRHGGSEQAHLMLGCFERAMYPRVSRSVRTLAPELSAPVAQGCCGALHAHNGQLERGRELARELGQILPGLIVTTAGGCAAHLASVLGPQRVQELSQWLAQGSGPAEPTEIRGEVRVLGTASRVGSNGSEQPRGILREPGELPRNSVSEPLPQSRSETRLRIGLQDSCHLRNALGVWREPRELLARVGEYVELPSAAACCGAAGTYAILRPRDSARVLEPHLDEIADADLDVIAVINPGCYRQLQQGVRRRGLRTRVMHLAELLCEVSPARPAP